MFMIKNGGIIGVSDHGGWAVLVTVARDGTLLDRRRVELVGEGLPKLPHHSEGQGLPLDEAVELVERVRVSAERHAVLALDAVTMAVSRILGVALRKCPQLPPTIAERIKDYHAQNNADWVMYRKALASAAEARGWPVHWYDAKSVLGAARQALRVEEPRRPLPPGAEDHRAALEPGSQARNGGGHSHGTRGCGVSRGTCGPVPPRSSERRPLRAPRLPAALRHARRAVRSRRRGYVMLSFELCIIL